MVQDDEFDVKMSGVYAGKEVNFKKDTSVYKKSEEILRKQKVKILETHFWNGPLLIFSPDVSPRVICFPLGFSCLLLCGFLRAVRVAKLILRFVGHLSFVALKQRRELL